MKMIGNVAVALVMTAVCAGLVHGQDLSKYRDFSFGASLSSVSKKVDRQPAEAEVIHQKPALIQELTWWSPSPYGYSGPAPVVQKILFSFYNGSLYRILVSYDNSAVKGLTDEDMIQVISAKYGTATRPVVDVDFPTNPPYRATEKVIARWEDEQYSLNLFRSSRENTFAIVMFTKQMDAQAGLAIAESVKRNQEQAGLEQAAGVKKQADDLEGERQRNLKAFRP